MNNAYATVQLKRKEDKRIRNGHLWIYSNEIDTKVTPLKSFSAGQLVDIKNSQGQWIGRGYINPQTLLCARVLTFDPNQEIDTAFFEKRISQALSLREQYFPKPFYRLIFGEGDFLPGLVVDRYGDTLSVQLTTAGAELLKDTIIGALISVIKPKAIVLRNDHSMRTTEGLESYVEVVYGEIKGPSLIIENDTQFLVPVCEGQKTGWFFDHGDNRRRVLQWIKGKRVLDVFAYLGSWSIQALTHGAKEAWAIDSSAYALEIAGENARLNKVDDRFHALQGDAFQQLKNLHQSNERFDVVLLDPPAFIKRRNDKKDGLVGYQRINDLAMKVLKKDGLLVTSSCSLHLETEELFSAVNRATNPRETFTQILAQGHQNIDHPIHPQIPETAYLKTLFCRVLHNNLS
jgi:23S rRNA (cytosine1962-C5)-methyltransferase